MEELDPCAHSRPRQLAQPAEIYFSVVQRKVLTPNDFPDLDTLEHQLLAFGRRYEQIAAPFQWKFTRQDLNKLLARATAAPPERLAA
jgi:hypothetical protein